MQVIINKLINKSIITNKTTIVVSLTSYHSKKMIKSSPFLQQFYLFGKITIAEVKRWNLHRKGHFANASAFFVQAILEERYKVKK